MPAKDKGYVSLRIHEGDREKLEKLAAEGERNLSSEIRLAIRRHLDSPPRAIRPT